MMFVKERNMIEKKTIVNVIALFGMTFIATGLIVRPLISQAVVDTTYTGKCAFVTNPRSSAQAPTTQNGNSDNVSSAGIVDFDNGTIKFANTKWTLCIGCADTFSQEVISESFTLTDDPEVQGAKEFSFPPTGQQRKFRLIAAAEGKTFIFQGKNDFSIGVCNKI